jgi:capsular polysaccharide transport system permease protein
MQGDDLEIDEGPRERPANPLARVRAMSVALNDAARRTRLSARRSRELTSGGFQGRRGSRVARYLIWASFVVVVLAPTLAAATYFGFIASDQYVAHAEFTVSAGESPLRDGIASFTGLPAAVIIQDTQIVTNFVQSREMVDKLEQKVGLRAIYSRPGVDSLSRFNPDRPVERLIKYWKKVATTSIKMPGGIVQLNVAAFSPEDAKTVADATLTLCENLVNDLNARINRDAVALAETGFERAAERLSKTLVAQEVARNKSGILETKLSAEATTALIKQLRGDLLDQTGAYESALTSMNADAPQMRERKIRLDVIARQIAALEGELTTAPGADAPAQDQTVAAAMVKFDALESEKKADLQIYENAAEALEHARVAAEFKIVYFKVFVRPSLPEEPEYPRRKLNILLAGVSSLAAWGVLMALASVVRNNMA